MVKWWWVLSINGQEGVENEVSRNKLPFLDHLRIFNSDILNCLHSGTDFSEEMLPTRFIGWFILEKIVFVRVLFVAF